MKRHWKTVLFLVIWTALLGVVYWGFGETPYSIPIATGYAVAATLLFVAFLLVNGGWRSLPDPDETKEGGHSLLPRADLLHLGPERQEKIARSLLILAAPLFFILLADFLYLHFFYKD